MSRAALIASGGQLTYCQTDSDGTKLQAIEVSEIQAVFLPTRLPTVNSSSPCADTGLAVEPTRAAILGRARSCIMR